MRGTLLIIICLMGFILFGIILEQSDYFTPIRAGLQDRSIPSPLLNFGKRGQIMKRLGLQYVVPKDYSRLFNKKTGDFEIGNIISLDTSRLKYRKDWTNPKQIPPNRMPSSLVMDKKIISQKIAILSVVIDRHDLYDQSTGIFKNYLKKGRNWERPCYISYYQGGKLLFATGAGVRLHGGKSRSHKLKSFRLYFRDIYGADQFKPGILFDRGSEPLKHLVIRKTASYPFVNPLAFDISREIGCIAPQAKPVKLYLNGSLYGHGNFVLIEHLSREYVMSHYGHDNFIFYRTKGRKSVPDEYRELMRWTRRENTKITLDEVQKHINIDNLSRWWISHLFCANSDPYQGVALLDKSKADPRWLWINWDMDHSFRNIYERDIQNLWEQKKIIHELMNKEKKVTKTDPRAIILRRLFNEDPEYRSYFQQLLIHVLNHRLNQNFLKSAVDFYERTAISFGITDREYINEVRLFMKHRPAFLMKLMQRYCHFPEAYPCQVKGPEGIIFKIDGFVHRPVFRGWYFKNSAITVEIEGYKKNISHWIINGERVYSQGRKMVHVIDAATIIKPVF